MSVRQMISMALCLAAALTTGCTSASETQPTLGATTGGANHLTPGASTQQAANATPVATYSPRGQSGGAVITFTRTGGFAGVSEMWTIYLDGRVVGAAGEAGRISADEVGQLLAEIEAADFFEWPPRSGSLPSCADCFTYSIVVTAEGKSKQITLVDGQTDAPEGAWLILERIQAVLGSVSG